SAVPVELRVDGHLIGSATAAGPLAVRGGQQTVTASWTPAVEGRHELCARANPGAAVEESGDENNESCRTVFVRTAPAGCDLIVEAPAHSPAGAQPGDALVLTASARNAGSTPCLPSTLDVTDGPASNARGLGTVGLPLLTPGASHLITVVTVAQPGTHDIHFTADPTRTALDVDVSNNVVVLQLGVGAASVADFFVSAIELAPQPVLPGEPLSVTAMVRNGGAPAAASHLLLAGMELEVPPLPGGTEVALTVTLAPPLPSAVTATVDARHALAEFDEANNSLTVPVQLLEPRLTVSVTATPPAAGPDTVIGISVSLLNTAGMARQLALTGSLVGAGGLRIPVVSTSVIVGPGASGFALPWNTARIAPGVYALELQVRESNRPLAVATTPFTVEAERATTAPVAVDRTSYGPRETVVIFGRVENASRNAPLAGAVSTLTVIEPSGVTLQSSTRPVPLLPALGHFDFSDAHALSPMAAAGTYVVTHEVRDGLGVVVAASTASFEVQVTPALSTTAQTTAAPVFPVGPPLPVRVVLTNSASAALPSSVLSVELYDVGGTQLFAAESVASKSVTLAAGASRTDDLSLPTSGLQPGPKLLVVRLGGAILQRLRVEAVALTDNEPPVIDISGVVDLQTTRFDVSPVITVTDFSASTWAATLDGSPFVSGTTVSTEGPHLLEVTATDTFGNTAFKALRFTIDKTPPSLTLVGPAHSSFHAAPVSLSWTASDATALTVIASLNGVPLQSGDTASTEGTYAWVVTATDAAGNSRSETRQFVLDFTAPAITVAGVSDGAVYGGPRTVTFAASDPSPATVSATLDGAAFASGSSVSSEGQHALAVTASDAAGNTSQRTVQFHIDVTAPVVAIAGVTDGALYASPRTITFSATDGTAVTVTATLDGAPFTSGSSVAGDGPHVLVVSASDAAGNAAQRTVQFRIDGTPPVITITGVTPGATGTNFTPVINVADATTTTVTATLDGIAFSSGTAVTSPGPHTLHVSAIDAAGNTASASVSFTVVAPGPGEPVFAFGACAMGNLVVRNAAQSTGSLAANGSATLENSALVMGDVVAGGNLTLRNAARVTGRGRHGGSVSILNAATVQGGTQALAPAPSPCQCSYDVSGQLAAAEDTNDNAAISSLLTAQGGIDLHNTTATLPGGTYYLSSLRLRGTARLKVIVGHSARLFVEHNVLVQNASTMGGTPQQSGGILVVSGADATDGGVIELENATETTLRVYAPRADIRLQNAARLTGAVVGKNLTLQNSHRLVTDAPSDGGIPLTCP
ncbi:MAG: hypothetical protein JNK82_30285, partial [Myxococcaceae bacterium]|nr:hypothetical protein [Myxococcaceae bacterium]